MGLSDHSPPPSDISVPAGDLPFSDGDITLPLAEILEKLPAHLVRPGLDGAEETFHFRISEFYPQILRGAVMTSLTALSRQRPEFFRRALTERDDTVVSLSLEWVVAQLPEFPVVSEKIDALPTETPEPEADVPPISTATAAELAPPLQLVPPEAQSRPIELAPTSTDPATALPFPTPYNQTRLQEILGRREVFDPLSIAQAVRSIGPARAVLLVIEEEEYLSGPVPDDLTLERAFAIRRTLSDTGGVTLPAERGFHSAWAAGDIILIAAHDEAVPPSRLPDLARAIVACLAEEH